MTYHNCAACWRMWYGCTACPEPVKGVKMSNTLLHITLPSTTCKPVETGRRASQLGYVPEEHPYPLTGVWGFFRSGDKALYSGVFFLDGTHMTWQFKPGSCALPEGVSEGALQTVWVVGRYDDSEAHCLIVRLPGGTDRQPR